MTKTPILQFGTSRFLQAHVDLFISQARNEGQTVGPITVVQTSGSAERAHRLTGLTMPGGFPIHIKGLFKGSIINRIEQVTSVARTLSAQADWQELEAIFVHEAAYIVTNTADSGYDISNESSVLPDGVPASFPGKLTKLLHARFANRRDGLSIMPCELISQNGLVLKSLVMEVGRNWYGQGAFLNWVESDVLFINTLVDRIVSEPLEPAGAVAEPYALWAIETQPGFIPICKHPSIVVAEDINSFEKLKLFILNLGHTLLADDWHRENQPNDLTVREYLAMPLVKKRLLALYDTEVVPGFELKGMKQEAKDYVASVVERFENPFLNHRLREIHGNHTQKLDRRIKGFINWSGNRNCPELSKVLRRNFGEAG